ncbi:MAG TPA: aconitase family protein, partial [Terriglobales bacterium]|nr:aconitase family protein [Terriglobales bacterium]
TGKDVIIALCGLYNQEEVLNAVVEFAGPGVASLSMDARLTIANMSTEWGTLAGWFPVDATTIAYMRNVQAKLKARGIERFSEADIARWEKDPPAPDANAQYAARIVLNLAEVTPHVSGPDTVQVMASLAEIGPKKVAIQKAYLVSCVNSRVEDLEAAAAVLQGRRVAPSVKFYLAPASKEVQAEAERRGIWKTIVDAGAVTLPAGCGPCIGLGTGLLEPGEVGISATNRNFKGRMGSKDAQCYLASPAVVAASAVAGYITAPESTGRGGRQAVSTGMKRDYTEFQTKAAAETVEILPGFPSQVRGRLVFMPKDNLNTDGIYPGSYTYRDDMTPEMMAKVIFENYDAEYAKRESAGEVVVGGFNFGTGSSREQAVTALKAAGIPLVIAGSFSQTYLRNAFNNGFLCIEVPEFVNRLKKAFAGEKAKTFIPGDDLLVDFRSGVIVYRGDRFQFPPLGTVPQSLVVAGGVENLVAQKLGLREKQAVIR